MAPVSVRKSTSRNCADCYFRQNGLCALDLDEPCSSFREARPEGLVPPRQPVLLMRPPRWAAGENRRVGTTPVTS